jgi:hypothetical protein
MKRLTSLIRSQFGKLQFLHIYVAAISREWMYILFGETLLGVIFLVWWALATPPLVLIFVSAAILAGYYAWLPGYQPYRPTCVVEHCYIEDVVAGIRGDGFAVTR